MKVPPFGLCRLSLNNHHPEKADENGVPIRTRLLQETFPQFYEPLITWPVRSMLPEALPVGDADGAAYPIMRMCFFVRHCLIAFAKKVCRFKFVVSFISIRLMLVQNDS
jgi:hypothetical protein